MLLLHLRGSPGDRWLRDSGFAMPGLASPRAIRLDVMTFCRMRSLEMCSSAPCWPCPAMRPPLGWWVLLEAVGGIPGQFHIRVLASEPSVVLDACGGHLLRAWSETSTVYMCVQGEKEEAYEKASGLGLFWLCFSVSIMASDPAATGPASSASHAAVPVEQKPTDHQQISQSLLTQPSIIAEAAASFQQE